MVIEKTARELVKDDVFLNSGAKVDQVVPCGNGRKVYIEAIFEEDGYRQVVTVDADQSIPCFVPDQPEPDGVRYLGGGNVGSTSR
jgi:hypothetical protein